MSLEWLVEDTFTKLDRAFLLENQTRKKLEDYFNAVIEEFRLKNKNGGGGNDDDDDDDDDGQTQCKMIVHAAIAFHQKSKRGNNGVCLFGKYHDVLYVAANLCYTRNLPHTDTVALLLRRIYECERTFERFFECAILGAKVTQLISGWRSYYKTTDENLNACLYFLRHATDARLTFGRGGGGVAGDGHRFVDVPMNGYECLSPLKTAVKAEKWHIVGLLMRYGALTYLPFAHVDHDRYSLFRLFVQKLERYGVEVFGRRALLDCFAAFVRSFPSVYAVWLPEPGEVDAQIAAAWLAFADELRLADVDEPRSLKHLAKCAARRHLAQNHLLPACAERLHVPKVVERYLNLETD